MINDIREITDFKTTTFSNFKKLEVVKELTNSLIRADIEYACYWCAELICAGHFADIWDAIIGYYSKYINIGSPKVIVYLENRIKIFKQQIHIQPNVLELRNNNIIRTTFCEILCVLCNSKQSHTYTDINIQIQDFDMSLIRQKCKAESTVYTDNIYKEGDPPDFLIATNEMAYNIIVTKCFITTSYWIEWFIEYAALCYKSKNKINCVARTFAPTDNTNLVWILWNVFIKIAEQRHKVINTLISSLMNVFSLRYTPSCVKKRKYLIFLAANILCNTEQIMINFTDEIIQRTNRPIVDTIISKINLIYEKIKNEEINMENINKDRDREQDINTNANVNTNANANTNGSVNTNTNSIINIKNKNNNKSDKRLNVMNLFGETFLPRHK